MKFIPTVILGLLAAWSLQAQGQLGGLVTDEKSAPIELATVLLRMADDTTIQAAAYTEADGRFSFPNLSAGVYVVEVSYVVSVRATAYCRVGDQGRSLPSKGIRDEKIKPPGTDADLVGSL